MLCPYLATLNDSSVVGVLANLIGVVAPSVDETSALPVTVMLSLKKRSILRPSTASGPSSYCISVHSGYGRGAASTAATALLHRKRYPKKGRLSRETLKGPRLKSPLETCIHEVMHATSARIAPGLPPPLSDPPLGTPSAAYCTQ